MRILSIDTSFSRLVVTVSDGDQMLAGRIYPEAGTHMAHVLPAIQEQLATAGVSLGEIDYFAASTGPGSFTGIRIGVATIQGFAVAQGKKCLALNTLEACASAHLGSVLVVPMLEARNRRIYTAVYIGSTVVQPPQVENVDTFMEKLSADRYLFCGDDTAARYAEDPRVLDILGGPIEVASSLFYDPAVLARLTLREVEAGRLLEPADLLPQYYAPTQAERNAGIFIE